MVGFNYFKYFKYYSFFNPSQRIIEVLAIFISINIANFKY